MHDQRNLMQDAVLRAQIAIANRLIAEQSAVIARAHSAIERAMETLGGPDGEGPTNTIAAPVTSICLRTNAGACCMKITIALLTFCISFALTSQARARWQQVCR